MTQEEKKEISKISQSFAKGFKEMIGGINGSGWMIADPLSAYLNSCGFNNTLSQLKEKENHPLVLILCFEDGSVFIPAGADFKQVNPKAKNWMWIDHLTLNQKAK